MKYISKFYIVFLAMLSLTLQVSCQKKNADNLSFFENYQNENLDNQTSNEDVFKLPNIDLSHWKVTLPVGKPTEVYPPEILSYATNETLKPFFYNDSINGALVLYAYPNSSTANSSYSRCELRELMNPPNNDKNWTFAQGGRMKGTLSMGAISKDAAGKYHKTIIMQIHGRLTNAQRDLIGAKDNNAPPMLKIYWENGRVRIKTKVLKNLNATETEMLHEEAWDDDEGYTIPIDVGFEKFTLEVIVSEGKMEVILNDTFSVMYDSIHIKKWGIFENYFKAGNYLTTLDKDAFANVKYYELEVSH
ncbi:MAG: alginate lyase [Flavobacteria bacterium RIFCSPLOWO2_12_FULL_35_11]|nr:MAG: alginate lyase [Flavobacteria bacterium RIFCSPLOWO2_12_FULL_35_11]